MNRPRRAAVVGAGGWGVQHARALSSRRDTVLTLKKQDSRA